MNFDDAGPGYITPKPDNVYLGGAGVCSHADLMRLLTLAQNAKGAVIVEALRARGVDTDHRYYFRYSDDERSGRLAELAAAATPEVVEDLVVRLLAAEAALERAVGHKITAGAAAQESFEEFAAVALSLYERILARLPPPRAARLQSEAFSLLLARARKDGLLQNSRAEGSPHADSPDSPLPGALSSAGEGAPER